jgi:hypothetical protein
MIFCREVQLSAEGIKYFQTVYEVTGTGTGTGTVTSTGDSYFQIKTTKMAKGIATRKSRVKSISSWWILSF